MIIQHIFNGDIISLHDDVSARLNKIAGELIESIKQEEYEDMLLEAGRFSIVNRVRGGKVERRKKVSNVAGYRFQDGRLVRMSAREKLNRTRAQKRGALKRKSKEGASIRHRQISIRRRGRL